MTPPRSSTPTVSRAFDDGILVELLYDPAARTTQLAIGRPDGSVSIEGHLDIEGGERLVPYAADNALIATGCILLPSAIGEPTDIADLIVAIRVFLHRYVDLDEAFEAIAAYYVLLSWVYDAFSDLPYLRFRGDFGTGKTRALLTVGSVCYKPFFASGASTVSPIFHIQDTFQGTLVLDEADFRFSDASAQLTKILNNGTTVGMPVLRTMANRNRELHPHAFRVFGPKIVAMRERFSDLALESRLLTFETSGRTVRDDIPIHLPAAFQVEARDLRNRLLAWRLRSRFSVGPDPARAAYGVSARYRQSSLALLSLIDDAEVRAMIARELAGDEARVLNERADTLEAAMLSALATAFEDANSPHAPINTVALRFNETAAEELGRPMSNKWVGGFIRKRLHLATLKTGGVYVVPATERRKLGAMLARYGQTSVASSTPLSPKGLET